MPQFHHKTIKKFDLDGQIHDECAVPRLKNEYVRLLCMQMKSEGYVPRIDIDPDFTVDYVEEKEIFKFKLSVYGVYVGKRSSEWIAGIDGYKAIYTQQSKSSESSQDQESTLRQS